MKIDMNQRREEIREYLENLGTTNWRIVDADMLSEKYGVSKSIISRDISEIEKTLHFDEKEFGVITTIHDVIDGEDVEIIWIRYEDEDVFEKKKPKYRAVKYFPNHQITTVCKEFKDDLSGKLDYDVVRDGMTKEEIKRFFPPYSSDQFCNISGLILSIIYEASRKDKEDLDQGNLRNLWYTHIQYTINETLGMDETKSIDSAITTSWKALVKSGLVDYEEMKIIGGKESGRLSNTEHSPFSNIIIGLEKMSFFDSYKWIPKLFNCTLICAGGEPSRAVIDKFILELKNNGVDLNQTFYLCIASDLDGDGYYIQHAFKEQLETSIRLKGGTGKVEIRRLFVRKDQVTDALLRTKVVSWKMKKSSKLSKETLKKTRDTRWGNFCKLTKTDDDPFGGLYKPVPPGFVEELEGDIVKHPVTGLPVVRAKLEMNIFSIRTIELSILEELQKIIRETSDETKIMIPEIMRVFDGIKDVKVVKKLLNIWSEELIDPEKKKFSKDIDEWLKEINKEKEKKEKSINKKYEELIQEKEDEKREREPELFEEKDNTEEMIETLDKQLQKEIEEIKDEYRLQKRPQEYVLEDVDEEINEKCEDLDKDISDLEDKQTEKLERIEDELDIKKKIWDKFKEEHLSIFNPVEKELEEEIRKKIDEIDWRFRDLEQSDAKNEISRLLEKKKLLLDDNVSCFDQPAPTFLEKDLLKKASNNHDENIEKVRKSFSYDLLHAMYEYIMKKTKDFSFTLSKMIDPQDLSDDIQKSKEEMEEEVKKLEDEDDENEMDKQPKNHKE